MCLWFGQKTLAFLQLADSSHSFLVSKGQIRYQKWHFVMVTEPLSLFSSTR